MKKLYLFLSLSVLFHLLGYISPDYLISIFKINSNVKLNSQKETPIEVSFEETHQTKSEEQTLVKSQSLPKDLIDETPESKNKNTNFMSDQTLRVKEQVQSKNHGPVQNSSPQRINPMLNPNKLRLNQKNIFSEKTKAENIKSRNELIVNDKSGEILVNEQKSIKSHTYINSDALQLNQSNVHSEKVKFGDFTALNTDRNLYYSYFSRIEDAIRPQWESEVQQTLQNISRLNLHTTTTKFKTRVDILLDKEGHFFKALLLKSSGVSGLDNAVINSFKMAQFFPHPPKGMINSNDGLIRLEYMFHVEYNP